MANVIDILIPFRLTINQPKSELKQARYHKNKKQKKYIPIKFGNMSLKFNYNSIYLIMSKRPKNDPNNMVNKLMVIDQVNLIMLERQNKYHIIKSKINSY